MLVLLILMGDLPFLNRKEGVDWEVGTQGSYGEGLGGGRRNCRWDVK